MAFNLGFQTKHILNPWSMLFHPPKVPLKVFSILSKVHSAHCERTLAIGMMRLFHFEEFRITKLWCYSKLQRASLCLCIIWISKCYTKSLHFTLKLFVLIIKYSSLFLPFFMLKFKEEPKKVPRNIKRKRAHTLYEVSLKKKSHCCVKSVWQTWAGSSSIFCSQSIAALAIAVDLYILLWWHCLT